jgi:tRNA threonylcarbamoyladenosine biosynthesis protein TsaB
MAYLLHIETATTNCSVALSQNGNLLHCIENNEADFRHSDHLHLFIEKLLKESNLQINQLSGVAVSMGPGSYTGLRIGVSTAKGLCYACDIPLIAINTLEVLAEAYSPVDSDLLIPMLDARRMEVFALVLNSKKEILKPTFAEIVSSNSFQEFQGKGRLVFFGNGAHKCKGIVPDSKIIYVDELQFPSAQNMISRATAKFEANQTEDVAYFEPFYLKDFYSTKTKN